MSNLPWPPAYQVKRHARARSVKFTLTKERGLQITVPPRFSLKRLPDILEQHKDWIIKHTAALPPTQPVLPPAIIQFLAFNRQYSVHYFQHEKALRVKTLGADGIIVSGDAAQELVWRTKLTLWVRKQAVQLLSAYFHTLATSLQLPYRDLSIRDQTTLWGSCSPDKSIRLNYKLIFLPEALMRHIMIHELCHTRFMDHSERFWGLVASFDEDWERHRRLMKKVEQYIPGWLVR